MNRVTLSSALALMVAGAASLAAQGGECKPLETRSANAASQQPAFKGQTRTCGVTSAARYEVTVVAKGLSTPWAVEPLPGGDFLVTEKPGALRLVTAAGQVSEPIAGLPPVDYKGQGGLLDVALSPKFTSDRTIFWSYTEPREGGNATSVARGVLSGDRKSVTEVKVIFRALPTFDGSHHFGSRLAFGPDGMLYISLGERSAREIRPQAQQLESHMGKVIRIAPDGSVPKDNPFAGKDKALPEIWSMGHRNIQAMAFDGSGQLWEIEHGTRGGDELNRVQQGKNYGWPIQAYGVEYSGAGITSALGEAATSRPNVEQPTYYWDPVIAPSGAQFYSGDAFPAWKGNLFVGSMGQRRLVRLVLSDNKVTGEEHLLIDRNERVRDVRQGPDGFLYVVTDAANGELWRISPVK
jgi:aldose sugar dehydrogenase